MARTREGAAGGAWPLQSAMSVLLVLLMAAGVAQAGRPVPPRCREGCPLVLQPVVGADGVTYQSECLAVCQGVRIKCRGKGCVHDAQKGRNPRALQLHRMLLEHPAEPGSGSGGGSGGSGGSRASTLDLPEPMAKLVTLEQMEAFKTEGFKLLGKVQLQERAIPQTQSLSGTQQQSQRDYGGDRVAALTQEDGASGGSGAGAGGVVRALRITPDGLLYSASYDLELLAKQLKQLAKELGEGSTGGMPELPSFIPPGLEPNRSSTSSANATSDVWSGMAGRRMQEQPASSNSTGTSSISNSTAPAADGSAQGGSQNVTAAGANVTGSAGNATTSGASGQAPAANATTTTTTAGSSNSTTPGATANATQAGAISSSSPTSSYGLWSNLQNMCAPMQFPFSAIGQLELRDPSGAYVCSGALVGPDAVLTAGHCVFRRDGKGGGAFYKQLSFAAGRYRDGGRAVNPFNITSWSFATVFDVYAKVPDAWQFDWDVAIIRLATPVGRSAGWLGMAAGCLPATITTYTVATAGYTASAPLGTCSTQTCTFTRDNCVDRTAYHTCQSLPGQSGSPFYVGRDFRVRGVLVGTIKAQGVSVAHLLGPTTYSALLKWVAEPQPAGPDAPPASSNSTTGVAAPDDGSITGGPFSPGDGVTGLSDSKIVEDRSATGTSPPPKAAVPPPKVGGPPKLPKQPSDHEHEESEEVDSDGILPDFGDAFTAEEHSIAAGPVKQQQQQPPPPPQDPPPNPTASVNPQGKKRDPESPHARVPSSNAPSAVMRKKLLWKNLKGKLTSSTSNTL